MKHISIIIPVGDSIVDTIIAPYNLLRMANTYYQRIHSRSEALFRIDLVGLSKTAVKYQGVFSIAPTTTIDKVGHTDLIIVAAISGNLEKEIENNAAYISWIKKQRIENGAEIASLCKGAFLLAETGLLNGKSCSTHWTAHNQFKVRYPKVNLIPEKIISEDNGIYSSGGAYSFLNFMLFLIEKYYGREVAIQCSKVSEIEFDRIDQSQFIIFSGQKEHNDDAIKEAQVFIEKNFENNPSIHEIAEMVNVSTRSFLRRFKKATSNTPLEYIQRVKIEAAKKKLEATMLNIQEVMYDVGYSDEKAFRNTFRKYSGLSPIAYRKKYNREMAL
ncbi:helix-turn-helix domain-containing protein [Fulvivirgaceae bacterium BMA10]|uniref:Helix-turn-helix domain-containing protein n=1 Tax=Splendidivirga corallicola TaxID=3051826 RepID=A0ABT8KLV8_9BACT|nr:helix-turn-helix domain-containing protein [Fulvivirgaceae bacterium BMA10]